MSEPMLFMAMRSDPKRHVVVEDPYSGKRFMGTTAGGLLAEYEEHIRQVKADARDEGFASGITYQAGNDNAMWNPHRYHIESQGDENDE